MKHFNKLIVFLSTLTLAIAMFGGITLAANEPKDISIKSFDVTLMPEYDTPDLLEVNTVNMYNNSDKPFQGELIWRVPKGATNVVVVTNEEANNNATKSLGQVRTGQQYDELYWTPPKAIPAKSQTTWHIEYYDPTAIQGTPDKTFTYKYQQPYDLTTGSIAILQPTKATKFTTDPAPSNQQATQQGNISAFPINAIKADQTVTIKVSYTKTDPNPSFSNNSAQGGQGQGAPANQPAATKDNTTLYALIGLIIIIAAAAIIIIMKNDVNNERRDIIKKRVDRKSHPDFYDDIDEFAEFNAYEDKYDFEDEEEIEEPQELVKPSDKTSDKTSDARQALRAKFEKGLITEVDYYEQLADLED